MHTEKQKSHDKAFSLIRSRYPTNSWASLLNISAAEGFLTSQLQPLSTQTCRHGNTRTSLERLPRIVSHKKSSDQWAMAADASQDRRTLSHTHTLARNASDLIISTSSPESLSLFARVRLWSTGRSAWGSSCSERCCAVSDNQSGPPAFPPHPPDWSRPCQINHRTHVHRFDLSTAHGLEMCVCVCARLWKH